MSKIRAGPSGLEQFVAAENRKARLFGGLVDVEEDSGLRSHPVGEFLSVGGAAARFGRDRTRNRYVAAPQFVPADPERRHRAVHRRGRQAAGLRQALAQPYDARKSVDDGEAVISRASDQQAAIVGAEIDCAVGMAVVIPLPRGSWLRWPALLAVLRGRRTGGTLRHDYARFLHRA